MSQWPDLANIRREYGELSLSQDAVKESPIDQFHCWFNEVVTVEKSDPTAMVLSTVDADGKPDSRVVLLKGIREESFIFYSNYSSAKGVQLAQQSYAALNFFWPQLVRQVRVRGPVTKVSAAQSDHYFSSRPLASQLSAIASKQSAVIDARTSLQERMAELEQAQKNDPDKPVLRPDYWGGYELAAETVEFWQGRDNRLHDRVQFYKENGQWCHRRICP